MITIFTPVYNRANIIKKLYQSLCNQTNKKFVWLIVDDGSTDNVEKSVRMWKQEAPFEIQYYYKENGGKHTAHNLGVDKCCTDYFICVDSDDTLSKDAVEIMYRKLELIKDDTNLAGVIFPSWNGKEKNTMPHKVQKASIRELYDKYGYRGETALLFKTDILRQYKFPLFKGEKFVAESVIYDRISAKYKMLLEDEQFYVREYQQDGYTRNIEAIHRRNPQAFLYDMHQRIELADGLLDSIRQHARYVMWCKVYKFENPYKKSGNLWMTLLATPLGWLLYIKHERMLKR